MFIRPVIQVAGAHLEGCVKRVARRSAPDKNRRRPLGGLLQTAPVKNALGTDLAADMALLTQFAVNPSKHDYTDFTDNSGQGLVFGYDDAIYAYFLARRFGCIPLQASGDVHELAHAVEDSTRQDRYFWGPDLSTGVG